MNPYNLHRRVREGEFSHLMNTAKTLQCNDPVKPSPIGEPMRLLPPVALTIALCMPALAQISVTMGPMEKITVENVVHVSNYRNTTIALSDSPEGWTFTYVFVPLAEFEREGPDTLVWDVPELISPVVFTAIYTSIGGIRIIIQVPCSRYSSIKSCAEAFADAVREMEEHFIRDPIASKEDTTIVIPSPKK